MLSKERGMTIIFTTHILYEVNKLCDRVAIMNNGAIVAYGTIPELRKQVNAQDGEDFEQVFLRYQGVIYDARINDHGEEGVPRHHRRKKVSAHLPTLLIVILVSTFQGSLSYSNSQSSTTTTNSTRPEEGQGGHGWIQLGIRWDPIHSSQQHG